MGRYLDLARQALLAVERHDRDDGSLSAVSAPVPDGRATAKPVVDPETPQDASLVDFAGGTTDRREHFASLAAYYAKLARSVEVSNPAASDEWRLWALRNLVWAGADVRVEDLPSDWRIEWEERAAVMEFDGGLPRERAEAQALTEILGRLRHSGQILE